MGAFRRAAVVLAAAIVITLGAAPASAGGHRPGPQPEVLTVTGPFTATGQLLSGCGEFHQIVDGGGEWSALGASTFNLDFCIANTGGAVWPVLDGGTFTVTSADGTLSGTTGGWVAAGGTGTEFPLHLELAITGGSGRFADASGALVLDGAFGVGAGTAWGDVSGTVTIPPPTPQTVRDCRHGGWRHVVDDRGRPFRNQRECIAFVLRHRV